MTRMKNVDFATPLQLVDLVQYKEGQVVSRTLAQSKAVTLTLFAFHEGEGLSAHSAPGDALVQILDGTARITIGDTAHSVNAGEAIVMPANVPHALDATQRFKMLLTLVKRPKEDAAA